VADLSKYVAALAKFSTAEIEEMIREQLDRDFEEMWQAMTPAERLDIVRAWLTPAK
jgi:acyl-CoA reductase-like NAD-dependent aldehyde dehydrogenase